MVDDDGARQRWLLSMDTSTDQAGICLTDGVHVAELSWDARRDQTTTLLSAIDQLLTLQRLALSDVHAIAVAIGPGAFTSLRVGVSTAKGLAFACQLPLIGVPTLDGAARSVPVSGGDILAVLAAGRSRLAWATYGNREGRWRQLAAPRNGTIEDLIVELQDRVDPPLVTGELDARQRERLHEAGIQATHPLLSGRRPGGLAMLAWDRLERGEIDDAASLSPLYLHGGPTNA